MTTPKVSIGMPVYNGEEFIRDALDSLRSQTFADFELIISDNASSDGTEVICRDYAGRDPRIRYVRQPENRGAVANFQFVLNEAAADYFMWAAADDLWGNEFIATVLNQLQQDISLSGAMVAPYKTPSFDSINGGYLGFEETTEEERVRSYLRSLPSGNAIFYCLWRRHTINQLQFNFDYIASDWTFIILALEVGKVRVLYEAECGFVKRSGGSSDDSKAIKSRMRNAMDLFFPLRRFRSSIPMRYRNQNRNILLQLYFRDVVISTISLCTGGKFP